MPAHPLAQPETAIAAAGSALLLDCAMLSQEKLAMEELSHPFSQSSDIVSGAVVFSGTRVPVSVLFDCLAAGDPLDEFLEGFPTVTREQAVGALKLAGEVLNGKRHEESSS